ncbi:MAG TPA: thioredoxin domain-containing protein, partial [Geobacteraceae bacterium]
DADSEGEEGTYYLWDAAEFTAVLAEEAELAGRLFGVTQHGNFEGRNILYMAQPLETLAAQTGLLPAELATRLASWRGKLATARATRVRPLRDEKIIAGWNGLMIAALAKGYAVTRNPALRQAAEQAAAFVATRLTSPIGRLQRSWHAGVSSGPAFLEDYAFVVWGLVELHQATLEPEFLATAARLADEMLRLFSAAEHDGLHETGNDAADLPARGGTAHDGVIPSSNGVAAGCLLRIGLLTGSEQLYQRGEALVRAFMGRVASQPVGYLSLLSAGLYQPGTRLELTLSGERDRQLAADLMAQLGGHYLPTAVVRLSGREAGAAPAVAVCSAGVCHPPVRTGDELGRLLDSLTPSGF